MYKLSLRGGSSSNGNSSNSSSTSSSSFTHGSQSRHIVCGFNTQLFLRNYASLIRCNQTCSLAKDSERRFRAGLKRSLVLLLQELHVQDIRVSARERKNFPVKARSETGTFEDARKLPSPPSPTRKSRTCGKLE